MMRAARSAGARLPGCACLADAALEGAWRYGRALNVGD